MLYVFGAVMSTAGYAVVGIIILMIGFFVLLWRTPTEEEPAECAEDRFTDDEDEAEKPRGGCRTCPPPQPVARVRRPASRTSASSVSSDPYFDLASPLNPLSPISPLNPANQDDDRPVTHSYAAPAEVPSQPAETYSPPLTAEVDDSPPAYSEPSSPSPSYESSPSPSYESSPSPSYDSSPSPSYDSSPSFDSSPSCDSGGGPAVEISR
jgi:hypothetical protein